MQQFGLALNAAKCEFAKPTVSFLGHQAKVSGISNMPLPGTVKEFLWYLSMVNYYRRFLPAASTVLKPLTVALPASPRAASHLKPGDAGQL